MPTPALIDLCQPHHQHRCCWARNVAHVLVAMVVGYMLAGAPGRANPDGGGGNHLCSGTLLALLGASPGDRAKGPFSWGRRPTLSKLRKFPER